MHKAVICLILLFTISGCDFNANFANRSGSLEDDYVEEPLSELSQKYEKALIVSNDVLRFIGDGNATHIYDNYLGELFKERSSLEHFQRMVTQLKSEYGDLKNFKEMQWGFMARDLEGKSVLVSSKIAEFEKSMLKFYFVFENDGKYERIIGMDVMLREGVAPPGTL